MFFVPVSRERFLKNRTIWYHVSKIKNKDNKNGISSRSYQSFIRLSITNHGLNCKSIKKM